MAVCFTRQTHTPETVAGSLFCQKDRLTAFMELELAIRNDAD